MHKIIIFLSLFAIVSAQSMLNDSLLLKYDNRFVLKKTLKEQGYIVVSLGKNPLGHFYCYTAIKGRRLNFIIDTGAPFSLISKHNFDILGFKKTLNKVHGWDLDLLRMETFMCTIDSIYIGDLLIDSLPMIVDNKFDIMVKNGFSPYVNNRQEVLTSRGIGLEDGIIGNDILSKYNAFLDLKRLEMYLQAHPVKAP